MRKAAEFGRACQAMNRTPACLTLLTSSSQPWVQCVLAIPLLHHPTLFPCYPGCRLIPPPPLPPPTHTVSHLADILQPALSSEGCAVTVKHMQTPTAARKVAEGGKQEHMSNSTHTTLTTTAAADHMTHLRHLTAQLQQNKQCQQLLPASAVRWQYPAR